MSHSDQEYLLARAERERDLAANAHDEIVRAIHLKLAHEYAVRAHIGEVARKADNDIIGIFPRV
jgi:hypothetical protein